MTVDLTQHLPTVNHVIESARDRMSLATWDYLQGGSESEATLRRNDAALERIKFIPRALRDVSTLSTSSTFLGRELAVPIMLAPVGSTGLFHRDGQRAAVAAAERAGTIPFVSMLSSPGLAEVASSAKGPKVFQLYVRGDRSWIQDIVGQIEASGYIGICLTADSDATGNRERTIRHGFQGREYFGSLPGVAFPNVPPGGDTKAFQAEWSWKDLEWLRDVTALPLIVKGLVHEADAIRAVEMGVESVYVSNHGGRALDHGLGTMEVLPRVVQAVGGAAEILVDGGIRQGADVVKALALGANAVLIGKLQCLALAAAGEDGLVHTLDLLQQAMSRTMAFLGIPNTDQLDGTAVCEPSW